ncbi:unnamed protein product [Kluyveromyces dobzhanskii CBS 2104]|uniref:WGS project CCBQ000000000 data, contig 00105 n=1 Tax=Kluyveromyces dobzhanskii CBS 2104 TaxID=1427455 RepID=A0A0A8L1Q3_9SACH|nr:unnamed protein product [Kluyveromyces dobzhanskii CBS 2104]
MASASKSNHDANKKKMSLEEFFSDNSLGESVWNEEEIDLNAINTSISNTTSLDVLKQTSIRLDAAGGPGGMSHDHMHRGGFGSHQHESMMNNQRGLNSPPYIVKFANLPATFSDYEIEDLFKAKRAQFVKFKLFWELNKTLGAQNEPTAFQRLFKRGSKVAFVEVYSYRDMDKILSQWKAPLKELHNIRVDMASFEDFKEYMDKDKEISPEEDASRPYHDPQQQHGSAGTRNRSSGDGLPPPQAGPTSPTGASQTSRRKSNPFGSAKPVDTQTKLLQIEQKVDQLGIEDTKTLRRLTIGSDEEDHHENETSQEKGDRVRKNLQILKREKNIDDTDSEAISSQQVQSPPPPKLDFMAIIKKKEQVEIEEQKIKEDEAIKENAAREEELRRHAQEQAEEEARRQKADASGDYSNASGGENNGSEDHGNSSYNPNYSNNFKFRENDNNYNNDSDRYNQNNNRRGRGNFRGRGRGNFRGDHSNGGNRYNNSDSNNNNYHRKYDDRSQPQQQYGLFAPAAGFLKDQNRGGSSSGGRGRGRGRGGRDRGGRGGRGRGSSASD